MVLDIVAGLHFNNELILDGFKVRLLFNRSITLSLPKTKQLDFNFSDTNSRISRNSIVLLNNSFKILVFRGLLRFNKLLAKYNFYIKAA